MCFLALLYKMVPEYSVVVAANRDEHYDRQGLLPRELAPGIYGGQDGRCAGTWLGVTRSGLVAGITNLTPATQHNPSARSRGLLCLDTLRIASAAEAPAALGRLTAAADYNEFNLLVADAASAAIFTFVGGKLARIPLSPGLHIIANTLPDSGNDPKVARGRELIEPPADIEAATAMLAGVCRDHGSSPSPSDAICIHGGDGGTLSSSIIALHDTQPSRRRYLFCQGRPCEKPYQDYSQLIG